MGVCPASLWPWEHRLTPGPQQQGRLGTQGLLKHCPGAPPGSQSQEGDTGSSLLRWQSPSRKSVWSSLSHTCLRQATYLSMTISSVR